MRKLIATALIGAALTGGVATPAMAYDGWRADRHDRYERVAAQRERDRYHARRAAARNDRHGDYCRRDSNMEGTVIGAVGGGVLGNVIAPRGDKTLGTVIGAALGGVIGNRVDHGEGRCR